MDYLKSILCDNSPLRRKINNLFPSTFINIPAQRFHGILHDRKEYCQAFDRCLEAAGEVDDIIALDLAGDELHFPGELFVEHFKQARDTALMDYLVEHQIGVESNLISNVQTSTVPDYAPHPLKVFLEHGIPATINTDDPGISAIDISYEYTMAVEQVELSLEQIR